MVHDFGGGGLAYAIKQPQNVQKIVLMNTWLWKTKDQTAAQKLIKYCTVALVNFSTLG